MDGIECSEKTSEPKTAKTTAQLGKMLVMVASFECPECGQKGTILGPPLIQSDGFKDLVSGKTMQVKCRKCDAMVEIKRSAISESKAALPKLNRHQRRAHLAMVK